MVAVEHSDTKNVPSPRISSDAKMDKGALGFNGDKKTELTSVQKVICGGVAGAFCRVVTNPFDLVKIRLQVQAEPIAANLNSLKQPSKYTGLFQAFRTIYAEEGLKGYYKGHFNGQLLSISNGIVQYGLFESSSHALYSMGFTNAHYNSFVAGYVSALTAIFVCYPVDLFRTRFSSQPNYYYSSISHASKTIYYSEGIKGFYKGVCPAMFSQAPQASIFFGIYSVLKEIYDSTSQIIRKQESQLGQMDMMRSTICSSAAGIISKIIMYPMDLIKKRMQIQGFAEGRADLGKTYPYSNSFECSKQIFRHEGVRGFYKGLVPGLAKAATVASSSLVAYEAIKTLMVNMNEYE